MVIKILGKGCKKCKLLEANTYKAIQSLGIQATIEKVTELDDIIEYGVMKTPGLVIDEKVVLSGRIASANKVEALIQNERSK